MKAWELTKEERQKIVDSIHCPKRSVTFYDVAEVIAYEAQKKLVEWLLAKYGYLDGRWQELCEALGIEK